MNQDYSSNVLGDLYEILLDLQTKCPVKSFTRVNISENLVKIDTKLTKITTFLSEWNLLMQLMGRDSKKYYNSIINALIDKNITKVFFTSETENTNEKLVINSENVGELTEMLKALFTQRFQHTINIILEKPISESDINLLRNK